MGGELIGACYDLLFCNNFIMIAQLETTSPIPWILDESQALAILATP